MAVPRVVIAMGQCSKAKQRYGIRFERQGDKQWSATWCFAIKELVAKREGYEQTQMNGEFVLHSAFPGCPYCSASSFFKCECGKLACWSGEGRTVSCPWCGEVGELSGKVTNLAGGGDR
jgi:hypothetical protein